MRCCAIVAMRREGVWCLSQPKTEGNPVGGKRKVVQSAGVRASEFDWLDWCMLRNAKACCKPHVPKVRRRASLKPSVNKKKFNYMSGSIDGRGRR